MWADAHPLAILSGRRDPRREFRNVHYASCVLDSAMSDNTVGSFDLFARWIERQVGSPITFVMAVAVVLIWAMALVGFRGDGAHHLTRAAIRAPSRAFPRRRALCTNSKKPR